VRVIETALQKVHNVVLKLKVMLVESQEGGVASKAIDDPLIRYGVEKLGGEVRDD
jgi:hypothetical protein